MSAPSATLLAHVLVPVADAEDASATANALVSYAPERVTAVNVVEKGAGVPDKIPVEQSEEIAEAAFDAFRGTFPDAGIQIRYDRDVVAALVEAAREVDASAIAFQPRGGRRVVQLLSGDRSLRLITEADCPVVVLPRLEDE